MVRVRSQSNNIQTHQLNIRKVYNIKKCRRKSCKNMTLRENINNICSFAPYVEYKLVETDGQWM